MSDLRPPIPVGERPFTDRRYHSHELPPTPQRTYRIPATGWIEAPPELLHLGDDLGETVEYKRLIGEFLLWRAGPPIGEAWYLAVHIADPAEQYRFRLSGKTGHGDGPDGKTHRRFRLWKESLLGREEPDV
ncbi:MAG: hypothetical protein OEO77_01935 [Acidimicrobiia bacterium]|nr:hypothetical protein [Acidimicrobiia bacterium]